MKEIEELKTFVNNLAYHHAISGSTCNELISKLDKVSNSELKPLLGKASSQPVFACGRCVECEYYEKIDDTEVQHEETFWETCHHPDINEMLCWDCEKIGCTEFKKRASKSA